jgi:hypothetical protein
MLRDRWIAIPFAAAFLLVAVLVLLQFRTRQQQVPAQAKVAATPSPANGQVLVAPLFDLDRMIQQYERRGADVLNADLAQKDFEAELLEFKKSGKTMWHSEKWMKPPEYYASLTTAALAEESFSDNVFYLEMSIYENPKYGVSRLRILHNGFAELFRRKDMWEGIVHAWDICSARLKSDSDLDTIVRSAQYLNGLSDFCLMDEFKGQTRDHQAAYFTAAFGAVRHFHDYAHQFKEEGLLKSTGVKIPFYGEPMRVVEFCLVLGMDMDAEASERATARLGAMRLSSKQNFDELLNYLDQSIAELQQIKVKQ